MRSPPWESIEERAKAVGIRIVRHAQDEDGAVIIHDPGGQPVLDMFPSPHLEAHEAELVLRAAASAAVRVLTDLWRCATESESTT